MLSNVLIQEEQMGKLRSAQDKFARRPWAKVFKLSRLFAKIG